MKTKLPDGHRYFTDESGNRVCTGASMGRRSDPPQPAPGLRFYLRREYLDGGGYDSGGSYWGTGRPLYYACSEDSDLEFFFRASDRQEAREEVQDRFPGAKFFR